MTRKYIIAALVFAILAAGVLLDRRASRTQALLQSAVPVLPSLKNLHSELAERIEAADEKARNGPKSLEALQELSSLYHANGFLEEAWICYSGLVEIDGDDPLWGYRLSEILSGFGHLDRSVPLLKQTIEAAPDYLPARIRLGQALLKQNLIDGAASAFEAAVDIDATNPHALLGLARVAIAKGDLPKARVQLERAVQVSSFRIGADLLVDVYDRLGLDREKKSALHKTTWGSHFDIPDPWILALIEECYDSYQVSIAGGNAAMAGNVAMGVKFLTRAIALTPNDPVLHFQIAAMYTQQGNDSAAIEHYERCVDLDPAYSDAWLRLVTIAKKQKGPVKARLLLDEALRHRPESPALVSEKAQQLLDAGQIEEAISLNKRVISIRPYEARGYVDLSNAYMAADKVSEAIEQMRIALKIDPSNAVALTTMAFYSIVTDDAVEAEKWIKRVENQSSATPEERMALRARFKQQFGRSPSID